MEKCSPSGGPKMSSYTLTMVNGRVTKVAQVHRGLGEGRRQGGEGVRPRGDDLTIRLLGGGPRCGACLGHLVQSGGKIGKMRIAGGVIAGFHCWVVRIPPASWRRSE